MLIVFPMVKIHHRSVCLHFTHFHIYKTNTHFLISGLKESPLWLHPGSGNGLKAIIGDLLIDSVVTLGTLLSGLVGCGVGAAVAWGTKGEFQHAALSREAVGCHPPWNVIGKIW